MTTATVAALLTILGFSLYDTIIVFDRIRENVPRMPRAAFSQIVNRSMSEVLMRSLATSFCTLLPILGLLFFGGETLQDFAFALIDRRVSGTYSSIFIAVAGAHALEGARAGLARRRRRVAAANGGEVPAYATAAGGAPVDVEPEETRRRAARLTAPERPEPAVVSQTEFEEMVRDLHAAHAGAHGRPPTDGRAEAPTASADRRRTTRARPRRPEDRRRSKDEPRRRKPKRPRNKRHGRRDSQMGHPRLGHDGPRDLALHDLPAGPLLGRHRRRVPRRARRRGHLRASRQRASTSPASDDIDLADGARGDPRRADRPRHRATAIGVRQGNAALERR